VRCIRHIINIAVQDALKQLKATLSDLSKEYRIKKNSAYLPYSYC
jgi:hypothetical protein